MLGLYRNCTSLVRASKPAVQLAVQNQTAKNALPALCDQCNFILIFCCFVMIMIILFETKIK